MNTYPISTSSRSITPQEYLTRLYVFLANITATKDKDKSKGKRLEDVPVVKNLLIFFLRLCRWYNRPPVDSGRSECVFGILGDWCLQPVARAPYRLAPSEMKELAEQL
ncbi:hypothetical protein Tco_0563806 [Tanacetum coccineum]